MTGGGAILWPMLSFLGYIPVLIYLVSRWRVYREQTPPDPQLGLKVALYFFRLVGLEVGLLGAALALWALLLGGDEEASGVLRAGIGLLLPGALVYVAHALVVPRTNDAEAPTVGRMFIGAAMVLNGLVATGSLVGTSVLALQKASPGEPLKLLFVTTMIFGVAWVVLARKLAKRLAA